MLTIGDEVAHWAQSNLAWGMGDPLVLTQDQINFLLRFYATDDAGRRLSRTRAVYCRPKGAGKSPLGAIIGAAEAFGPVVPAGLDASGMAVGQPRGKGEVLMLATEEGQASNTYGPFCDLVVGGSLQGDLGLDVGLTRTLARDGTVVMPLSAGSTSKDGRRTDFATFEETHLCVSPQLRELIAVIRRNVAKRSGRSLELTTAWQPGQRSVAELSFEYATAVAEGRLPDQGLLFDHREGPEPADWDDDEQVIACLAEAYRGCPWIDVDRLLIEVRDPTVDRAEIERYFLNRIVAASDAFIDPRLWTSLAPSTPPAPGEAVAMGFDGSWTDDATALVVVGIESGVVHLEIIEEAPPAVRGWEVDQRRIDTAVSAAFERYDVRLLYADPPRWQDWVAAWQDRYGDRVRPWHTWRERQMHECLERLHDAISTATIGHDGSEALTRHLGNATRRATRSGYILQKPPGRPSAKIDAAMALALAWEARGDVLAKGFRKRSGRLVAF